MQLVKCDKCGAIKNENESWYGMTLYIPNYGQRTVDLCANCGEELVNWLEDVEENE